MHFRCTWSSKNRKLRRRVVSQLGTQLIHIKQTTWDAADTHEADNLGCSWYTWSRQLGTQLIHMKQTTRDATDTLSLPQDASRTSPIQLFSWRNWGNNVEHKSGLPLFFPRFAQRASKKSTRAKHCTAPCAVYTYGSKHIDLSKLWRFRILRKYSSD
jgi:hypothetical protein